MGLFSSLFGKKKPATSDNKAYQQLNSSFSPWIAQGSQGMGQYANILGLGGEGAQQGALDNWWNSSGGDFLMNQGTDQIVGNRAAGGLLRSGGTSKSIEDYRSGLASTKLSEYMGMLDNMNKNALGAGNIISGAGAESTGASTSGGGLGKAIGLGLSLFSDPRLKTNIEKVGEFEDGLGIYDWNYIDDLPEIIRDLCPAGRQRGVMADEVAALRPDALGPVIEGYMTVNYGAL